MVIDGGNSHYHDDIRRAALLRDRRLHYVDVGTSGGVWGLERGYCLMIGGEEPVVRRLDPIFASLAPGIGQASRTPGREKLGGTAEHGYLHCGPAGAGHFVKMVHNGIEYGLMAAYAEGLNILRHANVGGEPARHRRGDHAAAAPGALPLRSARWATSPRCGGAAAWSRPGCSTSTASALVKSRDLGELLGPGVGLRRGPLDGAGRHRRVCRPRC